MATLIVSEEERASREQMAMASAELALCLEAMANRFEHGPERALAFAALSRRLVGWFERLETVANGPRAIDGATLRTLGRVFEDVAIKVNEIVDLVDFLASNVAAEQVAQNLRRAADLAGQAMLLVDLPVS
jgi:hypothetical protein